MRIEMDEDALTEGERALAKVLADVAYVDALRWIPDETERRAHLEAVAGAVNRVLPKARARVT